MADPVKKLKGREHGLLECRILEVKAITGDDGKVREVTGYAAVFGNVDWFGEVVDRGAFAKTIGERVPKGLVKFFDSHQWNGRSLVGTVVEAKEDDRGLWFRATVSSAPSAQDVAVKMAEGHLDRFSFGFDVINESYAEDPTTKALVRHLTELRLLEVSAAPMPVNEETSLLSVKGELGSILDKAPASGDHAAVATAVLGLLERFPGPVKDAVAKGLAAGPPPKAPTAPAAHDDLDLRQRELSIRLGGGL